MMQKKPQKNKTQTCVACKGSLRYIGKLKAGAESVELYRCTKCAKEFTNYELAQLSSKR